MSIVGMAETTVKESKDRVRSALISNHFSIPTQKIIINLAPAELPKQGGRFDLAIAIGILVASRQIQICQLQNYEFLAELSLDGHLRPVKSVLNSAIGIVEENHTLVCSSDNANEAGLISPLPIICCNHLLDLCNHFSGDNPIIPYVRKPHPSHSDQATCQSNLFQTKSSNTGFFELADIKGQPQAKRALEIAASGNHSILLMGPPGTGKTMLANRLPGLLPPLTEIEARETAAVYSISQQGFNAKQWGQRPFRAPHHTSSAIALIGGGAKPGPGEVSLAHNGILFLDELPEFSRPVLEVLREPLEAGRVLISRAAQQIEFPARFLLVCAMNPCPCGYFGDPVRECRCTAEQIQRYQSRISGPLLDRIDLQIDVARIPINQLLDQKPLAQASSAQIRNNVITCRKRQLERNQCLNANLDNQQLQQCSFLTNSDAQFLASVIEDLGASTRAYYKVLKIARTIADLSRTEQIQKTHLLEALQLRKLDRNNIH